MTSSEQAVLPEPHYDDPGCIECDWGEQPCHCSCADIARSALTTEAGG